MATVNIEHNGGGAKMQPAEVLPIPYPYNSMLAICSDLDETPGEEAYLRTCRYLNSEHDSAFGQGVGLEVGNSMFFDMQPGELSYWNASEEFRLEVRRLMSIGIIDSIHSLGDIANVRSRAEEIFTHLAEHNCRLHVWIDHAIAPSNFGQDIMCGQGDLPGSAIYIADLAAEYGIRYVWRGRVTSVIGQDVPRQLGGIWRTQMPLQSGLSLAKEFAKGLAGRRPDSRYRLHANNDLIEPIKLSNGSSAFEFFRSNPHPGGISCGDNAAGLATAIGEPVLNRLERRGGKAIIYTHLGKKIDPELGFPASTRRALEALADRQDAGRILVCTTYRLLEFARLAAAATAEWQDSGNEKAIVKASVPDWYGSLEGLSIKVPFRATYELHVNGDDQHFVVARDGDHSVLTVPWKKLSYDDA